MSEIPRIYRKTLKCIRNSLDIDPDYDTRLLDEMKKKNPLLASLILVVIQEDGFSKEFKKGYVKGAIQFYDAIRTQMELNDLEEQWKIDSDE